MHIRDRIIDFRRVPAGELQPNPKNWRTHPPQQREALQGILAEIGYADALLARRLPDGALQLIDGHLRAETTPDMPVPVLVVDLSEREADVLLAALDPLAARAGQDDMKLRDLVSSVHTDSAALRKLLDELSGHEEERPHTEETEIRESFEIVVECDHEAEQRTLYERLKAEGYVCRLLIL